jgi:hypothetical protein
MHADFEILKTWDVTDYPLKMKLSLELRNG